MSFQFPTDISFDEIQQCMLDLQIHLDMNQLAKPTSEGVRIFYEQVVISLLGVSREELMQPNFDALIWTENPEYFDDVIATFNFFSKLEKLMHICGITDFDTNDVFKPEPARLKRNICAIINFSKFRDDKLSMLHEFEKRLEEKTRLAQEEDRRHEELLTEVQRLKEHHASRQAEALVYTADAEAIAAKNIQLEKVHMTLAEEIRVIKAESNSHTDQAAELKLTINSLQNEAMELQDQIVQSPEKLRKEINDLIAAAERKTENCATLSSAIKNYDHALEMQAKIERELQPCMKLMEDLEEAVARKKEIKTAIKDTQRVIAMEEQQYDELASINSTTRRQLSSLQDKLSRTEQQGQLQLEAAAAQLEEQIKRREAVEAELAAVKALEAEQEAQIRQFHESAEKVQVTSDAKVKSMMDRYHMLRRKIIEYNRRLEEAMSDELYDNRVATLDPGAPLLDVVPSRDTGVAQVPAAMLMCGVQRLSLA